MKTGSRLITLPCGCGTIIIAGNSKKSQAQPSKVLFYRPFQFYDLFFICFSGGHLGISQISLD